MNPKTFPMPLTSNRRSGARLSSRACRAKKCSQSEGGTGVFGCTDKDPHWSEKKGFSLLEMVFYVALLALFTVALINLLLMLLRSNASFQAARSVNRGALVSMERMTRETRGAVRIIEGASGSVFGTSPGKLVLETTEGTVATTSEFYVESGVLKMKQNGVVLGALTPSGATVTSLVFRKLEHATSTAVKMELTIGAGSGAAARSDSFFDTIILRGS